MNKSYDTSLKKMAKRGTLPEYISKEINRSNISRWKKEADDKYFGFNLTQLEITESFLNTRHSQSIMKSYMKIVILYKNIILSANHIQGHFRKHKEQIVHQLLRFKPVIGIKHAAKLFGISASTFYAWVNDVQHKCRTSAIQLCNKTYPQQLTQPEVKKMKELLLCEQFKFWTVCSIAFYALRNKIINIRLATWYKYTYLLNLKRTLIKKNRHHAGIKTNAPNKIWHADITIVKTLDNMKNYIYLLMDNFSRFILNCEVSHKISGAMRLNTIKQAYEEYIKVTLLTDTEVIVDGGCENNNNLMDDYFQDERISLKKLIALKDIPFSNSIIEAQNKLIKYRYLFKMQFNNQDELKHGMEKIIYDYNYLRPHISLNGLTPYEAFSGKTICKTEFEMQLRQARKERIEYNRNNLCEICS